MAVIVDSSVWIDIFGGRRFAAIEQATTEGTVVLSPIVVTELLSGDLTPAIRERVGELLQEFRLHGTPLSHWMHVAELRRTLALHGIRVSIPDAHIAQCALDLDAILFSRDDIFTRITEHTSLRLGQLR